MADRRRYRKVFVRIWTNEDFQSLTDGERVMALYLLSGPQTNRVGLFRVSFGTAAEDLEITPNEAMRRLKRVACAFGWEFDERVRVLWIPSWWGFNQPSDNEKNFKGALSDLNEVPRTALIVKWAQNLDHIPEQFRAMCAKWVTALSPKEHRSNGDGHAVRSQEQEQEQETDQERDTHADGVPFDRFWAIYPKRKARKDAERAWRKLKPDECVFAAMEQALARDRASPEWRKDSGQFIPYPATWLNGGRWEDQGVDLSPPARIARVDWQGECEAEGHDPPCPHREAHEIVMARKRPA